MNQEQWDQINIGSCREADPEWETEFKNWIYLYLPEEIVSKIEIQNIN